MRKKINNDIGSINKNEREKLEEGVKKAADAVLSILKEGIDKAMNKFKFLQDEKKLKSLIFFLFFIPGTPKDLITYIAPLTKIKLRDFMIITLIARIPSVISSTYGGSALAEQNFLKAAIIYGIITLFSLAGIIIYRIWDKKHTQKLMQNNQSKEQNKV